MQRERGTLMDKTGLYASALSGVQWRKSTFSEGEHDMCVEVAELDEGAVAVRDSGNRALGPLMFTAAEWAAFTAGVRAGQF